MLRFSILACAAMWLGTSAFAADPEALANDPEAEKRVLGAWRVADARFRGEPSEELTARVYQFLKGGIVEIYAPDYEARFEYRIDVKSSPAELQIAFGQRRFKDSGIFEVKENKLRWRTAETRQPLRFDKAPDGDWWEYRLERLTPAQAEPLIKELQAERLRRKVKNH
jgi:hypothetical protein